MLKDELNLSDELLAQMRADAHACYNPPMCSRFTGDLAASCEATKSLFDAGLNW